MLGLKLLKHSLKMLSHDRWATARLTFFPLIIAVVVVFGLFILFVDVADLGIYFASGTDQAMTEPSARYLLTFCFSILVFLFAVFWSAVSWHRFVLLDEKPGVLLPKVNGKFLRSYIWAATRVFVAFFVLTFPTIILTELIALLGNALVVSVVSSALLIFVSALSFRLSLVLPSAAVGRPMSLRQSWQATGGYFGALIVVAIAVALLNWLAERSFAYMGPGSIRMPLMLFLNWLSIALGISILTTLYGVCVDKRTL